MRKFCMPSQMLHELEPLEVKSKDYWKVLYSQSLGGLLLTAAHFTVVLVLGTQRL